MTTRSGKHLWSRHPAVSTRGGPGPDLTFGEHAADLMRNAFGSWTFVGSFLVLMAAWMALNTVVLHGHAFDRFPFILLNLSLSMMAGLQGALILIASKRADRIAAEQALHHYAETNAIKTLTEQQMVILEEIRGLRDRLEGDTQ